MDICPVCGNESLVHTGHCTVCVVCGYSGCEDWEDNGLDVNSFDLGGLDAEVHDRDRSREENSIQDAGD